MSGSLDTALFGDRRFFTLPPGSDFLGILAETLIEITDARRRPEALSDALIFVPNRRSARVLAGRLFDAMGGNAFLPPDIRPLGDAGDNDPALLGELADIDVRPSMPSGVRLGFLTRLVMSWHETRGIQLTLASASSVARDLARLLDQAALVGDVDWSKLEDIGLETDLAAHWQVSVDFLSIVSDLWPKILEENGFSDTSEKDRLAADAMRARWRRTPPQTPVIVAGSTGTSPSSRKLMEGAVQLPRGAVLFPGLDTEVDEQTWRAILESPSHPQHAFADTLEALKVELADVGLLPGFAEDGAMLPRRKLIQESLAPADATADWVNRLEGRAAPLSRRDMTEAGLEGLALIEAETEAEEADAIALMMRETLETEGKTAALVTPDAGLARRVSSHLKRWGLHVMPSQGIPLLRTRAGSFLVRLLDFVLDPGEPVALAAFLKHPLTIILETGQQDEAISFLERGVLRGLRRWDGLDDLYEWTGKAQDEAEETPWRARITVDDHNEVEALVYGIKKRAAPHLQTLHDMLASEDGFHLRRFVETLAELGDVLTKAEEVEGPSLLWSGEDGAALARFLEDVAAMADQLPAVARHDLKPLISTLGRDVRVPDALPSHPRLFIWGPLEARLQTCDLMILGSLNEGSWPEPPAVDGFLPRHIRAKIGMPDTEARIGLSAHDFAQLACSRDVVMTRAKRVDNKPSVASRWLWRLRILASGALESLDETDARLTRSRAHILDWARAQHEIDEKIELVHPRPAPPARARPRNIRVTDVTTLIRDPYAYYARHILQLQPLDPLNTALGPREIGIAMHKALEDKDPLKQPYMTVEDLVDAFSQSLEEVGGDALFFAEREGIWLTAAHEYHTWLWARDQHVTARDFEISYVQDFEIPSGTITLRGRADLVERLDDESLAITDLKTGRPPSNKQVTSGLEPQLPLLAILASNGKASGRDDQPAMNGDVTELFYFGLGTKAGAQNLSDGRNGAPVPELIGEAESGFLSLMEQYADPSQPYLSGPRVKFLSRFGDYDRLARRGEWGDAGAEPGGDDA